MYTEHLMQKYIKIRTHVIYLYRNKSCLKHSQTAALLLEISYQQNWIRFNQEVSLLFVTATSAACQFAYRK